MSFLSRFEHFDVVASTNDIVAGWLARGIPEVALAIADHQTAGRGREQRKWIAPPGTALLLSLGFRPAALPASEGWRLAAVTALAMAEAAESVSGLADGTIGLKWPNDIVVQDDGGLRKLAGVLGESSVAGGMLSAVVVGIGLNCDWAAGEFPPQIARTMTSLREVSGRRVDREAILVEFLDSMERRYRALRRGEFDAPVWSARQRTTGHRLRVDTGRGTFEGRGAGVDPESGALLLEMSERTLPISFGEVVSCRLVEPAAV